jgi:hypothetical protein
LCRNPYLINWSIKRPAIPRLRQPSPDSSIQAVKKDFEINRMLRKKTFGIVLASSVLKGV